jgi:hypothetical protein
MSVPGTKRGSVATFVATDEGAAPGWSGAISFSLTVGRADRKNPGGVFAGLVHAMRFPTVRPGGHRQVTVRGGLLLLVVDWPA